MFFNFVFMFLWFYPPSAKTETKDTYKIPWWLYVNRGHFYFGQRGQPDFGFRGQINLAAGVIRAWVFQSLFSCISSASLIIDMCFVFVNAKVRKMFYL